MVASERAGHDHPELFGAFPADASAVVVDVVVPAGSVVLFNSRLLHAARQNKHATRTRYSLHLGPPLERRVVAPTTVLARWQNYRTTAATGNP